MKITTISDCESIVKKHFKTGFEITDYDVQLNRVSDIVLTTLKTDSKTGDKFLIKKFHDANFFAKELFVYKELFEEFRRVGSVDFAPIYYLHEDDVIVFENLKDFQFNWGKFDCEHVKLVLQTLASFHALSLTCLESDRLDRFRLIHGETHQLSATVPVMDAIIDLIPENDLWRENFKRNLSKLAEDFSELAEPKQEFRNVSCHGNVKVNNVMFKYDNGFPIECKLINFEMQKFAPPAYDVLSLIYSVTDVEDRKHHLHDFFNYYYDRLEEELKKLNSVATIPQEEFEITVKYLLPLIKLETACYQLFRGFLKNPDAEDKEVLAADLFTNDAQFKLQLTQALYSLEDQLTHQRLSIEDCFHIIKNKLGTSDYKLLEYKLIPIDESKGFLGDYHKLQIDVEVKNVKKNINLFSKFLPVTSFQKQMVLDSGSFYKELFFYKTLIPQIQNYGIDVINECISACYFSRNNDVIIFDDLSLDDYKTLHPLDGYSYELINMTVKKLAKLHAGIMIFEEKSMKGTEFAKNFEKELAEGFFVAQGDHKGAQVVATGVRTVPHLLEVFRDESFNLSQDEYVQYVQAAYEIFFESLKPSKKFKNVICHGDLWSGNILIKFENDRPLDCRFIDFQVIRYCPPAHDLLFLIHLTTSRKQRSRYLSEWLDLYHSELGGALERYNYDINLMYPYDTYLESCEYMKLSATCSAALYCQFVTCSSRELKKIVCDVETANKMYFEDRRFFVNEMVERDPIYRGKLRDATLDMKDVCEKLARK